MAEKMKKAQNSSSELQGKRIWQENMDILDFKEEVTSRPLSKDLLIKVLYFLLLKVQPKETREKFRCCYPVQDRKQETIAFRTAYEVTSTVIKASQGRIANVAFPQFFNIKNGQDVHKLLDQLTCYVIEKELADCDPGEVKFDLTKSEDLIKSWRLYALKLQTDRTDFLTKIMLAEKELQKIESAISDGFDLETAEKTVRTNVKTVEAYFDLVSEIDEKYETWKAKNSQNKADMLENLDKNQYDAYLKFKAYLEKLKEAEGCLDKIPTQEIQLPIETLRMLKRRLEKLKQDQLDKWNKASRFIEKSEAKLDEWIANQDDPMIHEFMSRLESSAISWKMPNLDALDCEAEAIPNPMDMSENFRSYLAAELFPPISLPYIEDSDFREELLREFPMKSAAPINCMGAMAITPEIECKLPSTPVAIRNSQTEEELNRFPHSAERTPLRPKDNKLKDIAEHDGNVSPDSNNSFASGISTESSVKLSPHRSWMTKVTADTSNLFDQSLPGLDDFDNDDL